VLCILPEALVYQIAEKMKIAPSDGVFAPKWPKMSFFFFSQGSHRKSKMSNARSQAGNASPNSFQLGEKIGSGEKRKLRSAMGCSTPNGPKIAVFSPSGLSQKIKNTKGWFAGWKGFFRLIPAGENNRFAGKKQKNPAASPPFDFSSLECDSWSTLQSALTFLK
jgi:hypothetical protein